MSITKVEDLAAAVALATQWAADGTYNLFRGQVRDWGSVRSTYARLSEEEQEVAWQLLKQFKHWARSTAEMSNCTDDELTAIAQHYQFDTPFLDFSTDPRVAGFFATQKPLVPLDPAKPSCIMCLNTADLHRVWVDYVQVFHPDAPEPRYITVALPELWRLNAQRGVFLDIRVEPLEDQYDLDRIYFPPTHEAPPIPEEDIYPRQQSALEIAIDQFKMIQRLQEGQRGLEQFYSTHSDQVGFMTLKAPADRFEAECFEEGGLPPSPSWNKETLAPWGSVADEKWLAYSTAKVIELSIEPFNPAACVASLTADIAAILTSHPDLRMGPVVWRITTSGELLDSVVQNAGLFWDGCRRLPYTNTDIAAGLAATVAFASLVQSNPGAVGNDKALERKIVEDLLGRSIEVEMGLSYGNYTRGYASEASLKAAVRPDFVSLMNETWRPQITGIIQMLQIAQRPQLLFEFEPFSTLFVREVIPTQLSLRGPSSGKARIYNPERLTSFGLP